MSGFANNKLNQSLDISGSRNQQSNLDISDEANQLGEPIQNGSTASITVGATVVVSGLSGFTAASVGRFLTISGAATSTNNGTFLIASFINASSVTITNSSAVTDGNNGSLIWAERKPYSIETDLNYTRTDRANIKGVGYNDVLPTYYRCTDQVNPIPANILNIAGKTTDAKAFVIDQKIDDVPVNSGDSFITLFGSFPYAKSNNIIGIPVSDGYDAGNLEALYVEIIADGYDSGVYVLDGYEAGNRVFGFTREGTTGLDGSAIEIEFRSVAPGDDISLSVAYTWETNQISIIDIYYGFRQSLDAIEDTAFRKMLVNGLIADSEIRRRSGSGNLNVQATQVGQVLFSKDGSTFEVVTPVTSSAGWLVNGDGTLIVV